MKKGTEYARGISICSPRDTIEKKKGMKEALGKARKAMGTKENSDEIKDYNVFKLYIVSLKNSGISTSNIIKHYKSVYQPELTDFEKKLFETKTKEETKS